jgi:hypothetical protein
MRENSGKQKAPASPLHPRSRRGLSSPALNPENAGNPLSRQKRNDCERQERNLRAQRHHHEINPRHRSRLLSRRANLLRFTPSSVFVGLDVSESFKLSSKLDSALNLPAQMVNHALIASDLNLHRLRKRAQLRNLRRE